MRFLELLRIFRAIADLPDFGVLEAHLKETSRIVRKDFDRLLRGRRS